MNNPTYSEYMAESEKILDLARELYHSGEITREQLQNTYFHRFYFPNLMGIFNT